jgi:hypothetical protein
MTGTNGDLFTHKSSRSYLNHLVLHICVCVCAHARAGACVFPRAWACACACVHVALLIQHGRRMRHIVTSFVAPLARPYFSTKSHKRCDFRKKTVLNIKCVS